MNRPLRKSLVILISLPFALLAMVSAAGQEPAKQPTKKETAAPKFKKIDVPPSPLVYRTQRTLLFLAHGGADRATFGVVVNRSQPPAFDAVFEFGQYKVVGAEISFDGSPNVYRGWYLSGADSQKLPSHIFVSNEPNKVDPRRGYPVGFWETNPRTGQAGWQFRYDAPRLPYQGNLDHGRPKG